MELTELKNNIISAYRGDQSELNKILELVEKDDGVYPFNEYEFLTNTLIASNSISYSDYLRIRREYIDNNPYLWVFEISAPRGFGEKFAESFILGISDRIKKPNKQLDPKFSGEYDLWVDGIRIEVKASRVVNANSNEPLYKKALSSNTDNPFLMNFQQLKPDCCDVFIWMAVFRDKITTWILNSNEVLNHKDYSKGQHRGNIGNEGQLHITNDNISSLDMYKFDGGDIVVAITSAHNRNSTPQ